MDEPTTATAPKRRRYYRPTCACGAAKVDGRCTATPSCNDYERPHKGLAKEARRLRERERAGEAIGLDRRAVAAAAHRIDPRQAAAGKAASGRALVGWRGARRGAR